MPIEKSVVQYQPDGSIKDYVNIEFPGNVINVDKAMEMLGGDDMISEVSA